MPTFILTINWTDQGIRTVKDAPKRSKAARELVLIVDLQVEAFLNQQSAIAARRSGISLRNMNLDCSPRFAYF